MQLFNLHRKREAAVLVDFVNNFAHKSKKSRAYLRKFHNLANRLAEFEKYRGITLYTNSLSLPAMEDFVYYLNNTYSYRPSTICSFYGFLQVVLKRADALGYAVDFEFKEIKIRNEHGHAVSLSEDELLALHRLNSLSNEAKAVRDLFLIGSCTGLRFSDYSRLTAEHFKGDIISIRTKKTKVSVQIPVHWMIREVIERNEGNIPKVKSQQAFNTCIKRVCKAAKINESILIEQTEGNKLIRRRVKKYKLICSHTARRSFATNLYLRGVSAAKIMLITGHETESAFFRYIRISKEENARELSTHPFFRK